MGKLDTIILKREYIKELTANLAEVTHNVGHIGTKINRITAAKHYDASRIDNNLKDILDLIKNIRGLLDKIEISAYQWKTELREYKDGLRTKKIDEDNIKKLKELLAIRDQLVIKMNDEFLAKNTHSIIELFKDATGWDLNQN